jgi:hypothetical protein
MTAASAEGQSLLITNVQIFDGVSDRLRAGHVLISGRTVAAIYTSPIPGIELPDGRRDGPGRPRPVDARRS